MNEAQFKSSFLLAPLQRKTIALPARYKIAAVLIPLVIRDQQLHVLLTQRAAHLRHHPGQISFPGGGFEPSDHTLRNTALRETYEEIGIPAHQIQIIGQMGQYRTQSNYIVTPFVSFVSPDHTLKIDHNEVDEVFEIPWTFFYNRENHHQLNMRHAGKLHKVHFMPFDQRLVWGTTACIIHDLVTHMA